MSKEIMLYYRVLLVDDKITLRDDQMVEVIRQMVADLMTKWTFGADACNWQVSLAQAGSRSSALAALKQARNEGEDFDLVLLDLSLPEKDGGTTESWEHGLALLDELTPAKTHARTVVFSASAEASEPLRARGDATSKDRAFDDWITRAWLLDPGEQHHSTAKAKLRRAAVPGRWIAERLAQADSDVGPLWIRDPCMIRVVHELYLAARERRPHGDEWPLSRILLLGPPGSGKSALGGAFRRMLPAFPKGRAPLAPLNCASLVGSGHGGLIALFGAQKFGKDVSDSNGVFVTATSYTPNTQYDRPLFDAAGVAFLDEFVEMDHMLQASVLNCLEDGKIVVEGSRKTRRIGCHVICATNQNQQKLVGKEDGSLRQDLVDRMFRIIDVPSLSQRKAEVVWMLRSMSARHLSRIGGPSVPSDAITLSNAAQRTLDDALRAGFISSIRQLQAVVRTLEPGETVITDANLGVVFKKVAMLGFGREDIAHQAQLRDLGLLNLAWKDMTEEAQRAVENLPRIKPIQEWAKQSDETILLLSLLAPEVRHSYGNKQACAKVIENVKKKLGLRAKDRSEVIAFLTGRRETIKLSNADETEDEK